MIGKQILHYKILEKLGEGGMGVVYLAEDTKLKRQVAIKFLPHHISSNEEDRKRFEIEAQAAALLNHPNIATIYATEETDSEVFIVMEFIDGIELKDKIKSGPISTEETINIAIQIAKGLEAAHKKGIIHRDIKSQNVMIAEENKVKVMDFGLAKIQGETGITKNDSTPGTVSYMSPEQATSELVDHRSDIWSFGVLLYEMIKGELPFKGKHEAGILYSIVHSKPPKIQNVDCPEGLTFIVQKALVKNPDERYQNMSEVLNDLKTIESGNVLSKPSLKRTSHKALIFTIALIAVCIIALVIFFLNNKPDINLPPMRTVRITSYPGEEYYPALSPDGQSIAFSWNGPERDNFDIYTKKIDGGEPVRLTRSPFKDTQPEWSPDGQYIAFIREYPLNPLWTPKEIFIIPAKGGQEKSITNFSPGAYQRSSICWSGDAKFIFYTSWDRKDNGWFTIYKVSVETKQSQLLPTYQSGINEYSPRVSPDGKYFLFYHNEIGIKDMDAKGSRFITDLNIPFRGYAWLNDSRSIIFAANLDGTSALWKTDISGKKPTKVLSGININNPSISGDGKRLAYAETIQSSSIWKIDLKEPQNETLLIRSSELKNGDPDISPDGRKILFYSNRTGTGNIWICNSDGSNPEQLTFFEKPGNVNAVWSPSGSKILIKNKQGSFVLNITGGKPKLISDHTRINSWAKDDSGFYSYDRKPNVFYLSADKSRKEPITKERGCFPVYHNKYVYYLKEYYKHDIWRVPAQGGREEPVIEGLSGLGRRNWTVGQKGIYFVQEAEGSFFLKMYDFKSKQIRPIKELPMITPSPYSTIDVAPDDSYLLYTRHENKSDIILVKNFRIE